MNEALRKELGEYGRLYDQLVHTKWRIQNLVSKGIESNFPNEEFECYAHQETAIDEDTGEGEELLHITVEFKTCESADLDKLHFLQQALGAIDMKVCLANLTPIEEGEEYVPRLQLEFDLQILPPFQ